LRAVRIEMSTETTPPPSEPARQRAKVAGGKKGKKGKKKSLQIRKLKRKELLPILQILKQVKPGKRPAILEHLDDPTCESLYELVHNVISNERVPKAKRDLLEKKLKPHKDQLRFLARKNAKRLVKKKAMSKMGGFPFSILLSAAIPLITSLLLKKK